MTAVETEIREETELVEAWRAEQLEMAGYGAQTAAEIAMRQDIDLHLAISSYCFFRVANRHSFGALFDRDLSEPKARARSRQQIVDMILAWLSAARA